MRSARNVSERIRRKDALERRPVSDIVPDKFHRHHPQSRSLLQDAVVDGDTLERCKDGENLGRGVLPAQERPDFAQALVSRRHMFFEKLQQGTVSPSEDAAVPEILSG